MSVPPYVCGAAGLYIFALSSDRRYVFHDPSSQLFLLWINRKERGYHIVCGLFIALVGLIITVTVKGHGGKYAGLCILLFGSYVSAPLTVAWLSGNTPGKKPNNSTHLSPPQIIHRGTNSNATRTWKASSSAWCQWLRQFIRSYWITVVPSILCSRVFDVSYYIKHYVPRREEKEIHSLIITDYDQTLLRNPRIHRSRTGRLRGLPIHPGGSEQATAAEGGKHDAGRGRTRTHYIFEICRSEVHFHLRSVIPV